MTKRSPPEPICQHCGGSGCEPEKPKPKPTSAQKRILNHHAFHRYELFKMMDRIIAMQVIPLEIEWKKPDGASLTDLYEESCTALEKAGQLMDVEKHQLAHKALFYAATNLAFILESYEFGPHDLKEEEAEDEE